MDTKVIKTFLEVSATGHFGIAAAHLNVAQTTVSARIRSLEERFGAALFQRSPSGASLTPAGRRLARLAPIFLQLGERMEREIADQANERTVVRIGLEYSLCDEIIMPWVKWLRKSFSKVMFRVVSGTSEELLNLLADASLEMAVMYAPRAEPGLKAEILKNEQLGLYTTDPRIRSVMDPEFVYVDWGPEFSRKFEGHFPDFREPELKFTFPTAARKYIIDLGGAVYGRVGIVKDWVARRQLQLVKEAPVFEHPIYIVSQSSESNSLVDEAINGLKQIIELDNRNSGINVNNQPRDSNQYGATKRHAF